MIATIRIADSNCRFVKRVDNSMAANQNFPQIYIVVFRHDSTAFRHVVN